jgi:hypothetical protein
MRAHVRAALAAGAALLTLAGTSTASAADGQGHGHGSGHGGEIVQLLLGTVRFHRLAVAEAAGYGVLADAAGLTCIEDPGGAGAMGTHYVNGGLVGDGEIDAGHPEALLYDLSGRHPRLLGAEYVVFVADWDEPELPELFGHEFHLVDAPNRYDLPPFYELHAWVWKHNPSGLFNDWNPRVDC